MTSLTAALNIASSGLAANASQTAITSRNITHANDAGYSRKSALLVSLAGGGLAVSGYARSADGHLLERLLDLGSSNSGQQALLQGVTRIAGTVGDPEDGTSVAAALGRLDGALRLFESRPSDQLAGLGLLRSADEAAASLRAASGAVQSERQSTDREIAASVGKVTSLLQQFKVVNNSIVRGEGTARDLTEYLDERDRILSSLSAEVGIRTVTRPGNDIAIYLDGGVTLFDRVPRSVSFQAAGAFSATTAGNPVYVDGVPVTAPGTGMTLGRGRLAGLVAFRDAIAPQYQTQLDEVARGLIEAFAEIDQSVPATLPARTGLFTYSGASGAPALPPPAAILPGLAAEIRLQPAADPNAGGQPWAVRDGGFNGAAYVANPAGLPGFAGHLNRLVDVLGAPRDFAAATGLAARTTLVSYAEQSAGWLEETRQKADAAAAAGSALQQRAGEALRRSTGVSIDEEMTLMLDLERSYQASARLLTVVDSMLRALLEAA